MEPRSPARCSTHRRRCGLLPAVVLLALLGFVGSPQAGAADDIITDIVLLIDRSTSMAHLKKPSFEDLKARIVRFLNDELPPKTAYTISIVLIDREKTPRCLLRETVKDKATRDRVVKVVNELRADSQGTNIVGALQAGLDELEELKKQWPDHQRLLFLISDGKHDLPDSNLKYADLLERLKGPQLRAGEDFFFWYAHLGSADADVAEFAGKLKDSESKLVEADWRLRRFAFNRRIVRLAPVLPGDWQQEFPPAADRERGEVLTLEGSAGVEVKLGPAEIPGLPDDARIEISPETLKVESGVTHPAVLTLKGVNVPPGRYVGRIPLRATSSFTIPSPRFFHVEFEVLSPVITLGPGDELDLGRATPEELASGKLTIKPNEHAARLRPSVTFAFDRSKQDQSKRAADFEFRAAGHGPSQSFAVESATTVAISAGVPANRPFAPGPWIGEVVPHCDNRFVKFDPERLPVRLTLEPLRLPLARGDFEVSLTGNKTIEAVIPVAKDLKIPQGGWQGRFGEPVADADGMPPLRVREVDFSFLPDARSIRLTAEGTFRQPGLWNYTIPLISADPWRIFDPVQIRLGVRYSPGEISLPQRVDVTLDADGRGNAVFPVSAEGMAADQNAAVQFGKPVSLQPGSPALRLAPGRVDVPRGANEPSLQVTAEPPLSGQWGYRVPVTSDDPRRFPLNRAEIHVVLTVAERLPVEVVVRPSAFLTQNTRSWPFCYRYPLADDTPVDKLAFEFQLPGQPWLAGTTEPDPRGVLLRSQRHLPPLNNLKPGDDQTVKFRLQLGSRELATWEEHNIRVVPPRLVQIRLFRKSADSRVEPLEASNGKIEQSAPVQMGSELTWGNVPQLENHWILKDVTLLQVRDDLRAVQSDSVPPERLDEWSHAMETDSTNVDSVRIWDVPPPPASSTIWFPRISRNWWPWSPGDDRLIVAVARYERPAREQGQAGTPYIEEWTPVLSHSVDTTSWSLCLSLFAAAAAVLIGLAVTANLRSRTAPLAEWQIMLQSPEYDLVFVRSDGTPLPDDRMPIRERGGFSGWLVARLWPTRVSDPVRVASKQTASQPEGQPVPLDNVQTFWFRLSPSGSLSVRSSHGFSAGEAPILAWTSHALKPTGDGESQLISLKLSDLPRQPGYVNCWLSWTVRPTNPPVLSRLLSLGSAATKRTSAPQATEQPLESAGGE